MIAAIMDKKLRVLAAGCIHGDSALVQKLASKAEKEDVDAVILTGDLTLFNKDTKDLIKPFLEKNKKVLFVTGNHDGLALGDFLAEYYKVNHLHGSYAVYEGVGLFGCSLANIGPEDTLSEKDFFETLNKGHEKVKDLKKKIMVTHVHPSDSKLESLTGFAGSDGVRKAIDKFQPDLVFCSHLHELAGFEEKIGKTKVINVSRTGKVFEI